MLSFFHLFNTLLTFCLYIVILRLWMQYIRADYYNPCTQFIIKITQPILAPLRRLIPSIGMFDTATFLVLYLIALAKIIFISVTITNSPYWQFNYLLYSFYAILYALGHLIFWLLLIRAILSWISQGQSHVEAILSQLTEPLILPIRRIIPPIGGIDISFMIFVFILMLLNSLLMSLLSPIWGLLSL